MKTKRVYTVAYSAVNGMAVKDKSGATVIHFTDEAKAKEFCNGKTLWGAPAEEYWRDVPIDIVKRWGLV